MPASVMKKGRIVPQTRQAADESDNASSDDDNSDDDVDDDDSDDNDDSDDGDSDDDEDEIEDGGENYDPNASPARSPLVAAKESKAGAAAKQRRSPVAKHAAKAMAMALKKSPTSSPLRTGSKPRRRLPLR
jgi:hypothetical protein